MPRLPIDYSNTVIYKIVCNDLNVTECYVGHTTDFVRRKQGHKNSCHNEKGKKFNLRVYQIIRGTGGWENYSMVEVEKYPCNDANEACAKEREWYEKLNSSLNTFFPQRSTEEYYIDNKNEIAIKNKKWYIANKDEIAIKNKGWYIANKDEVAIKSKEWYIANKDEVAIKSKEWRIANKDEIAIKSKEWRIANKDEIAQKKKEYYENNRVELSVHKKEYYEHNRVEILERVNKYREENKDIIRERRKIYRENNKDKIREKLSQMIVCECGREITCCKMSRHIKTKVHNDNLKILI